MKRIHRIFFMLVTAAFLSGATLAADDVLRPGHPSHYVVKKGDTLWDIAGMFLKKPWLWPEIWYVNPQIRNPHLIYPGDELDLVYVNGKPRLTLKRGPIKLSPRVRSEPLRQPIPTIPIDHIAPYLTRPYVIDDADALPYVVAFADEHIMAGAGQRLYVRGTTADDTSRQYDIVRPGKVYKDGKTGKVLGWKAIYVGSGKLLADGDPATLSVSRTQREILTGDRLLPFTASGLATDFHPKAPTKPVEGTIIDALDRINEIGLYDVVVIDRGRADGITPGTVLQIDQEGEVVPDRVARERARRGLGNIALDDDSASSEKKQAASVWETVKLPDEEAGLLMVFRSFERVSFGLVMYARKAIHLHDKVVNP